MSRHSSIILQYFGKGTRNCEVDSLPRCLNAGHVSSGSNLDPATIALALNSRLDALYTATSDPDFPIGDDNVHVYYNENLRADLVDPALVVALAELHQEQPLSPFTGNFQLEEDKLIYRMVEAYLQLQPEQRSNFGKSAKINAPQEFRDRSKSPFSQSK